VSVRRIGTDEPAGADERRGLEGRVEKARVLIPQWEGFGRDSMSWDVEKSQRRPRKENGRWNPPRTARGVVGTG
jgi:hypothetical protein